jgi:hypothetical protein
MIPTGVSPKITAKETNTVLFCKSSEVYAALEKHAVRQHFRRDRFAGLLPPYLPIEHLS